ncbi:GPI transamidase component GPI16 [Wickerhamiella sorbophila]|uniref:GPI transamidase component GPI16 n=1 Tax=Wickerhamiella sorbophila TaxID=45607 RepID=A0A2T0FII2_9ASCO|nr:GPI transamidase component GPI16 [Wickerhamiella sorbophila]PRT54812.1 GPI transamidase component GPI16 [Wickerhamiella sorbophila]
MLAWLLVLASGILASTNGESYHEDLVLRPLPKNKLLSSFRFVAEQRDPQLASGELTEYTTFPRSLGQIMSRASTHELHLRFSQGWWDAESWGVPPANGTYAGGVGVEMWAWVAGEDLADAQANWHRLAHSLSGFFCASLNFLDQTVTTHLESDALPRSGDSSDENLYLLRGALPAEPVCTENLTPFIKLLPCKSRAGIASLLDGHQLFDSQWQTMSVDVDHIGDRLRLTQVVSNVIDVPHMQRRRRDPLPRPEPYADLICKEREWSADYICLPDDPRSANWVISEIFDKELAPACPLAGDGPHVFVEASDNWTVKVGGNVTSGSVSFSLGSEPVDLVLSSEDGLVVLENKVPDVFVDRSFTGYGQQSGGLRTVFTNPHDVEVSLVYIENLPWYMRLYLHTMSGDLDIVEDISYTSAEDRTRPSKVQLHIRLPPLSQSSIEYKFDKSLLYIEEYPPDANHGFEVPPALALTSTGYSTRTTSLLLSLAVPDFSMPYNVIILTCTTMAMFLGSFVNLIVKKVVPEPLGEKILVESSLKRRIQAFKTKLIGN